MAAGQLRTAPSHVGSCPPTIQLCPVELWKPDADVDTCSGCKCSFTWLKRRHHCRACGNVMCATCAPHRNVSLRRHSMASEKGAPAASMSTDRLRVCADCVSGSRISSLPGYLTPQPLLKNGGPSTRLLSKDPEQNHGQFREPAAACCSHEEHAQASKKMDAVAGIISLLVPAHTAEIAVVPPRTRSMDSTNSTAAASSVREHSSMADRATAAADAPPQLSTPNPSPPASRPGSATHSTGSSGRGGREGGVPASSPVTPTSPLPGGRTTSTRRMCINCGAKYVHSSYMEACSLDCNAMAVLAANARAEQEAVSRARAAGPRAQGQGAASTTSGRTAALVPIPLPKAAAAAAAVVVVVGEKTGPAPQPR